MNRLGLSYRGTQRPFSVKFVGRSKYCLEIPQTSERLYPLFALLRSSSARMKIENRGDLLTAQAGPERKRILGIFLGIKGNSNYLLSSEEVCSTWFAMKFSTAVSLPRLTNPAIECSGAKMYYNTYAGWKPNSTNINPAKGTTFGTVLLSKKVKRTNMLQYKH